MLLLLVMLPAPMLVGASEEGVPASAPDGSSSSSRSLEHLLHEQSLWGDTSCGDRSVGSSVGSTMLYFGDTSLDEEEPPDVARDDPLRSDTPGVINL